MDFHFILENHTSPALVPLFLRVSTRYEPAHRRPRRVCPSLCASVAETQNPSSAKMLRTRSSLRLIFVFFSRCFANRFADHTLKPYPRSEAAFPPLPAGLPDIPGWHATHGPAACVAATPQDHAGDNVSAHYRPW